MSAVSTSDSRLDAWLNWQLGPPDARIQLGLDRVAAVSEALALLPLAARTVVVAGTNGKGSSAALIERLTAGAARVGVFSSPHLWRYNERFRIAGAVVDDAPICAAFAAIETARAGISLTYFEYSALAALWLFRYYAVDLAVLEVGLGGRLDAVNIVDADVALITSIGLDHRDWLGDDRSQIGREKAGVLRPGAPAIGCDRDMPASVVEHAEAIGARLSLIGRDFDVASDGEACRIRVGDQTWHTAIGAHVVADNLAGAAAVVTALGYGLSPSALDAMARSGPGLAGRCEFVDSRPAMVYDVAHNVEAIEVLVDRLTTSPAWGRTHVILGMLADKPVAAVAARLAAVVDRWYAAGLDGLTARGLGADALIVRAGIAADRYQRPALALAAARQAAAPDDRIVVCGSFHTVADARQP